jgi:hypothetical protein
VDDAGAERDAAALGEPLDLPARRLGRAVDPRADPIADASPAEDLDQADVAGARSDALALGLREVKLEGRVAGGHGSYLL